MHMNMPYFVVLLEDMFIEHDCPIIHLSQVPIGPVFKILKSKLSVVFPTLMARHSCHCFIFKQTSQQHSLGLSTFVGVLHFKHPTNTPLEVLLDLLKNPRGNKIINHP